MRRPKVVSMPLDVLSLGEILVEVMRSRRDVPHYVVGEYIGPYPSGAPAIFIDACARLGLKSGFIGVVGDDDFGKLLIERLREDGVDTAYLRVKRGYTTGTAFVMYYSSGLRRFIFHLRHAAAGQLSPEDLDPSYLSETKVIHVMGSSLAVSESSRDACYKAVQAVKDAGGIVSFDPNLRPELLDTDAIKDLCEPMLKASDIVMPSLSEAEMLAGVKDPIEAARRLLKFGPKTIAVKLGDRGSVAATRDEVFWEPAFEVDELDPTGAGDVYDAAFIFGLLNNWPLRRIVRFANAAGAIKVTRFGPMEGPSSHLEVEGFLAKARQKATHGLKT
jgi:sugar/nucleoside kinase (ribokinase family)